MASSWGSSWGTTWGNSWGDTGAVVTPPAAQASQTPAGSSSNRRKRQLVIIGDDLYDISSREELEAILDSRLSQAPQKKQEAPQKKAPVFVIPKAKPSEMARQLAIQFYKPGDIRLDWSRITRLIDDDESDIEDVILLH